MFGQDKALEALSSAVKMSRAGLGKTDKPIGSFLFSGPTGVGKTEAAKQLASSWASGDPASTCPSTWSGMRSTA